jgi:hypothetical protein
MLGKLLGRAAGNVQMAQPSPFGYFCTAWIAPVRSPVRVRLAPSHCRAVCGRRQRCQKLRGVGKSPTRQALATVLHAGTCWKDCFQPSSSGSALSSDTVLEISAFIFEIEARTCADAFVISL